MVWMACCHRETSRRGVASNGPEGGGGLKPPSIALGPPVARSEDGLRSKLEQPGRGFVDRVVPADLFPAPLGAAKRATQPIRILEDALHGVGLRAKVAFADWIVTKPVGKNSRSLYFPSA